MKKQKVDMHYFLLDLAGHLLLGGPVLFGGYTYEGEEAREKGFEVIALHDRLARSVVSKNRK